MKKPKIEYPCSWEYKIIGKNQEILEAVVAEVINDREYGLVLSKKSKTGKYLSLGVKTRVLDESDRNKIFSDFSNHSAVKMVL
jgi:putative lipoic acid-binding regulatory protein